MSPQSSVFSNDLIIISFFVPRVKLLHDQVGVVSFEPYKDLFMETFARSRTCCQALPSLQPLFEYPHRNWLVFVLCSDFCSQINHAMYTFQSMAYSTSGVTWVVVLYTIQQLGSSG